MNNKTPDTKSGVLLNMMGMIT
ncbi:hypothetical protein IFVP408_C1100181 [Vibrio parahaemolyticus]